MSEEYWHRCAMDAIADLAAERDLVKSLLALGNEVLLAIESGGVPGDLVGRFRYGYSSDVVLRP